MSHPEPEPEPARQVDLEDVDDVIGLAAEMHHADEGKLTVEELSKVAEELELPTHYVEQAVEALELRRSAARDASARHKRTLAVSAVASAVAVGLLVISALTSANALRARAAEVAMRRAQVATVVARRDRTVERVAPDAAGRDAQAELAGADNRVAIETRRYDEAASAYNVEASSFPANLWAPLFGAASDYPLSSEIDQW